MSGCIWQQIKVADSTLNNNNFCSIFLITPIVDTDLYNGTYMNTKGITINAR